MRPPLVSVESSRGPERILGHLVESCFASSERRDTGCAWPVRPWEENRPVLFGRQEGKHATGKAHELYGCQRGRRNLTSPWTKRGSAVALAVLFPQSDGAT